MKVVITGGAGCPVASISKALLAGAGRSLPGRERQAATDRRASPCSDAVRAGGGCEAPNSSACRARHRRASPTRALIARTIGQDTDSVFHLAAVVSGEAEQNFDLGMRVNVDGTARHARSLPRPEPVKGRPPVVFTSSLAVFGGACPTLPDITPLTPQTSYGAQKPIGELLLNDMSRKGFIDGRALRLPTIMRAAGQAEQGRVGLRQQHHPRAARGLEAICPVERSARMWIFAAPRRRSSHSRPRLPTAAGAGTAASRCRASRSASTTWSRAFPCRRRGLVTRIRWEPDAPIERISPAGPTASPSAPRASASTPTSMDEIIAAHSRTNSAASTRHRSRWPKSRNLRARFPV